MRISEQRAHDLVEQLKETGDWRNFIRRASDEAYELSKYSYRPREMFTEALIKELEKVKIEDIVLARLAGGKK